MLHPFVGTRPLFAVRPVALLLSSAVHVFLVYAAFTPRTKLSPPRANVERARPPATERVRFFELRPSGESKTPVSRARSNSSSASTLPGLPRLPRIKAPVINPIALAAPSPQPAEIDFRAKATDSADFTPVRLAEMVKGLVRPGSSTALRTGPYTKGNVDKAVLPFANNPNPEYPWRLRSSGVEGSFVAQFVVDSTGRVVDQTMLFPPSANALFVDSVRRALRRARYYPAEVDGQRVPQLVEQRFSFVLVR